MSNPAFSLKEPHHGYPAGTVVFKFYGNTCGLISDDERATGGLPHTAVTADAAGEEPFFTIPTSKLAKLEEATQ